MPNDKTGAGPERTTSSEIADIERQLWEFEKQPDPATVPEARLRPGAFLYRIYRTWHSLGRGNGLAAHTFRALRDELLKREPPVRNLQPKLYGNTPLSQSDAGQLIDVMLETWEVARDRNDRWRPGPLHMPVGHDGNQDAADNHALAAIRDNLVLTLFKTKQSLLIEEPVGVPPELFMNERGRTSLALIIPTKSETTAYLSPSNAYGGFSSLLSQFFDRAIDRQRRGASVPLVIWVLRLGVVRNNSEFHQAFHCLASYSACLTNWYFRLSRRRGTERENAQSYWEMITGHSVFAVHGLPNWAVSDALSDRESRTDEIDEELADLDPDFFVPSTLPIVLNNHQHVRSHRGHDFALNVSIEPGSEAQTPLDGHVRYWLFPSRPGSDHDETADTTGMPVFDADISPGKDFDLAFQAIYTSAMYHLRLVDDESSKLSFLTLKEMGWRILTIQEFQSRLLISKKLGGT